MGALLKGEWSNFGKDEYFRKFEAYSMQWPPEISLDTLSLTSAPFGGLIAVVRDRKKVVKIQGGSKPVLSIYNAAGVFVSSFVWDSGHIIQMGWSSGCDLLCVREDGQVLIYDMFSNFKHKFGMGKEAQDIKVVDAKIFCTTNRTGVAVLTTANTIFLVNNVKEVLKVRKLPEAPGGVNNSPSAWVVVCEDRSSKVLFAREKYIYCLSEGETHATLLPINLGDDSCLVKDLAVSFNFEMLAVLTNRGKLWMGSVDGTSCRRICDVRCSSPHHSQMMWCGNYAVVINWGQNLDVFGFDEEYISYPFDDSVFCVQEIDCIRVISNHSTDLIQKVPKVVQDIFVYSNSSPGSSLLSASYQFQKKSHLANEYLLLVKGNLFTAVMQCIDAAGHQFDVEAQRTLMKAAQSASPLTFNQLHTLTLQGLMELLMIRRHHFLALDLASFLKMPDSSKIQLHWACYKVQHSKEDVNKVAQEIKNKLGNTKNVSFREIADEAFACGKHDLAIKLIEYEPRADLQIPLLLKLKEHFLALNKAIESGNTDLVYAVLDHTGKKIGEADFQMAIRRYPLAQALYLKHCAHHNKDLLKDVFTQEDDHKSLAELSIKEGLDPRNSSTKDALLVAAHESYKRAKLDVNAQLCDEQLKLFKYQRNFEDKYRTAFTDNSSQKWPSLHETVKQLLKLGEIKLADRLRTEYKVPDRRYWWLRIQILGEQEDFAELEKFSKQKKNPIGFEPFVDICLKKEKKIEAKKYLPKVRDELKVQYYTKLGMLEEAAQIAYDRRDPDALKMLASLCDPILKEKVNLYIRTLGK
ncbi:hypothetical protein GE061_018435 [Apolygus lucorum]|uniref:Vacuolar protein sorting-associated protein 16 homolog n=1 Tax=Apolygus lucorum TaxID=248454 RepID=A0A8S9XHY4_APOLU|nr:hypothetical protein GE061_018435 [Apolygus lucorum]